MTVPNFPQSPSDGDSFVSNGITYVWNENGTNEGYWQAQEEDGINAYWSKTGNTLFPTDSADGVEIGGGDITLNANGSGEFAGQVVAGRIFADGSVATIGNWYSLVRNTSGDIAGGWSNFDDSFVVGGNLSDANPANWTPNIKLNDDGSAAIKDITNDGNPNNGSTEIGFRLHENGFLNVRKTGGTGDCITVFGTGGNKRVELRADGACSNTSGGSWGQISSERRLKQNIELVDPTTAWETIKTLPYYSYQFISDPEKTCYGPVVDECPADMQVTVYVENEDGEQVVRADAEGPLKTYDNLLRDARLFVALQEALKRIETLEAEMASLKGGTN